jgi:hypothetical protein
MQALGILLGMCPLGAADWHDCGFLACSTHTVKHNPNHQHASQWFKTQDDDGS